MMGADYHLQRTYFTRCIFSPKILNKKTIVTLIFRDCLPSGAHFGEHKIMLWSKFFEVGTGKTSWVTMAENWVLSQE